MGVAFEATTAVVEPGRAVVLTLAMAPRALLAAGPLGCAAERGARSSAEAQPLMMLCTGETCGWPGSAPSSAMIGSSVAPNASNDSSESQTSNT